MLRIKIHFLALFSPTLCSNRVDGACKAPPPVLTILANRDIDGGMGCGTGFQGYFVSSLDIRASAGEEQVLEAAIMDTRIRS